ncbi:hypothetical protein [Donghicola eburneus]|jgi:hypothetical protein|uniref:hypothetical protein n=1 Tax=Donghicola eburneus TaxID=393278 RepID=UPI0008E4C34B|nr:hypothetical protein [Donghicola eburneus]SFQ79516.1 hypothetical protein SAMN05421764_1299 [Donghicola eburneus]
MKVLVLSLLCAVAPVLGNAGCLEEETEAFTCKSNGTAVTLCWGKEARLNLEGYEVRTSLGDVLAMDAPDWTASTLSQNEKQYEVFHAEGLGGVTLYENNSQTRVVMCDPDTVTQTLSDLNKAAIMTPSPGGK